MNSKLTSIIDHTTRLLGFMTVTVLLLGASVASGSIIIFDDSNGTNWNRPWYTGTQTSNVYEGTTALKTTTNQLSFTYTGNLIVAENSILQFYLNNSDADTASTALFVSLNYYDASEDSEKSDIRFTSTHIASVYDIDSVSTPGPISTDSNPTTWQAVELDLTQSAYVWNGSGYSSYDFDPSTDYLRSITIRTNGGSNAETMIADSVALIPEPSSILLLLIGCGSVFIYRHKRK
ncbi:PEP-CTERM sorting domain-containing protein [Kiritimatiellota bacterium B12222]|nr:PEP-CTERM sorting domain-containing protein [Kiritimatiellota bacterium B12222]